MDAALTPTRRTRELIAFFVLTFVISWGIEIPIALSVHGLLSTQIPLSYHWLAAYGPLLAALIVTRFAEGPPGIRRLLHGLTIWRVERSYVLFVLLAPPILFAAALVVARLLQGSWPALAPLGQVDYLPYLGVLPALGLWLLTWGFGEEVGWRGFALPRLQAGRSAFSASMLLGVIWGIWHIPAHFYRDTLSAVGLLLAIPMLLISLLAASCVFTWLYNGTRGSLLMVILLHGWFNYLATSPAGGDYAPIVMSALMVFWAVRVVNGYGRENLAPVEKVVV